MFFKMIKGFNIFLFFLQLDDWNKLDLSTKLDDLNSQVQSKEAEIGKRQSLYYVAKNGNFLTHPHSPFTDII